MHCRVASFRSLTIPKGASRILSLVYCAVHVIFRLLPRVRYLHTTVLVSDLPQACVGGGTASVGARARVCVGLPPHPDHEGWVDG